MTYFLKPSAFCLREKRYDGGANQECHGNDREGVSDTQERCHGPGRGRADGTPDTADCIAKTQPSASYPRREEFSEESAIARKVTEKKSSQCP